MDIVYKNTKTFNPCELEKLFLSVNWSSGKFPEKLVIAMKNSGNVFSAWDNDSLIGLVNVLDDGIMTAYVHFLLVNPMYHGKKIGRTLIQMVKDFYKDYLRIVLIAYDDEINFYKNCGFDVGENKSPMFITSLWT